MLGDEMIWESHFWKDDLLRYARSLQTKTKQRIWREASGVIVEKTIFLGFYSIRKLIEAKKLSSSFDSLEIPVILYPPTGKAVTLLNWHKTDVLFDLKKPRKTKLKLPFLANQAIHSYVFHYGVNDKGGLSFVFLASDRQRKSGLYRIAIREVISVFRKVGMNYPAKASYHLDPKTKDYEVFQE